MTTEQTTIPKGITALADRCWELVYPGTGMPFENGDGTVHYPSLKAAKDEADAMEDNGEDGTPVHPRECDGPCWLVISACGWRLDDVMEMHHATAEEALRVALDCDMRVSPAGAIVCPPGCDDCVEATR